MADDGVSEFLAVTNSDVDTAKFYLESCNGDVTSAVESYFANHDSHAAAAAPPPSQSDASIPPSQPVPPRPRVAGFDDMPEEGHEFGDDDNEGDEGPEDNEYYAGGEKSGVAVKGGKKDNVEDLFESARRHGAVQGTESDLGGSSSGVRAFTGQARTLAGDAPVQPPAAHVEPQPIVIAFYTNGVFTIDDGEPRHIDDPRNAEFLQYVRNGECPPELENRSGGRPAKVNLVRKGVDYEPPKRPSYTAFSGTGRTLASGDGGVASHPVHTESPGGGDWEGADESKPVTSIQIRFRDGSRAVARFNYSHTVRDIRRFMAASRPDLPNGTPILSGIPPTVLSDDSITIEQADLVNAVVTQK